MSDTSASASNDGSPFLNRVRTACRRKGYSYRTEKTYLRWIVRYVKYHGTRHPRAFGKREVRAYLSYLATERETLASTGADWLAHLGILIDKLNDRVPNPSGPCTCRTRKSTVGASNGRREWPDRSP